MKTSSTSFAITVLAGLIAIAAAVMVPGCGNSVNALSNDGGGAGPLAAAALFGGGGFGGGIKIPVGMTQCSDGIDNDGDGKIDYGDPECVGPLDNDEGTFATGIPGDNVDACKQDCFFDGNSGMGDDGCDWQLKCDPMTNNADCPYDAAYAQSHMTECSLSASQSVQVHRQLPQAGAERLRLLRLLHGSRRHDAHPAGAHVHRRRLRQPHQVPAVHAGHPVHGAVRTLRGLHRQADDP